VTLPTGGPPVAARKWWRHRLMVFGVSCLILCVLFLQLASGVSNRQTQSIDGGVRQWMLDHQSPAGVAFFQVVTGLGEFPFLAACAVVVAGMLVRRGVRLRAVMVAGIPFLPRLIVHAIKDSYHVTRPPGALEIAVSTSFPSGHTSAGTAVALVLGYALTREGIVPHYGLAVAAMVAIIVGLSRLYLDMHWASDVIGGWMVGTAFAGAVCALYELMRMARSRRTARQPRQRV
jgi:membrane-associated phospholipid phosphatase